ncbi:SspB family protein [Sphingoaurantiacus capsulatus]|uniref:SspB family protein n=1 Tax=Sphingoaurantiacus capsulatus TaxID=1771310 RepID=A0ABV7X799_9SPHN
MNSETPPESLIPYDEIVQEALRSVVRRVLTDIEAAGGLPGNHHFYIAFKTRAPGVDLPKHLSERYPDEMTIVIQHRYWDLQILEDQFSIGLSFNQVPAKLTIPYSAITGFVDPAVNFALQFQAPVIEDEDGEEAEPAPVPLTAEEVAAREDGSNVVTLDAFRKK